jgi:hypothetical protein
MSSRIKTLLRVAQASFFCALWSLAPDTHEARADAADLRHNIVVIVSAASNTQTLTFTDVRNIFMGLPTYAANGEPYVPLVQAAKTFVRVAFDAQFLGLDPEAAGRYWVDQRIRARRSLPRTIPSVELLRRVVAAMPGAVGYLRADELRPGIVPVRIDGVDFRSPEYRYRIARLQSSDSGQLAAR